MRIMHTMLRVTDLKRSVDFYINILGMREIRRMENPEYKYTLVFVGYDEFDEGTLIELTYNWDVDKYDHGTAYGHICLEVDDIYQFCDRVKQQGGVVTRDLRSADYRRQGRRLDHHPRWRDFVEPLRPSFRPDRD